MSENTQDESAQIPPATLGAAGETTDEGLSQTAQPEPSINDEGPSQAEAEQPASVAEQPAVPGAEPLLTSENALPPEAQGEANGGPLGCCLGTMIGLLLSLSLAILSRAYAEQLGSFLQGNFWLLGLLVRILMGIMAFALAIFFGYVGWKLGKRFYREYEPPPVRRRGQRSGSKQR